jgi:hypothetical protein
MFCSFLALMLKKELTGRCQRHGVVIEWADLLRDLDRLQEATIDKDGKHISTPHRRHRPSRRRLPGCGHRPAAQSARTHPLTTPSASVVLAPKAGIVSYWNNAYFSEPLVE